MGLLMPVGLWEVLPNETIRHSTNAVIRMSPMLAPVMHPVTVRVHTFFVSMRNAWGDNCGKAWEDFITGGKENKDNSVIPTIAPTGRQKGDVLDYLGVPPVDGARVNVLPVRAVNQCWNEFYRDQDLEVERGVEDLTIPNVSWEKDMFTTARPWPQKGDEITLPVGGSAPLVSQKFEQPTTAYVPGQLAQPGGVDGAYTWPNITADLSAATAVSVTEFRRALALQRMAEQRARYGSRYAEFMRYSFGASPRDARLQRPEYLGGGRVRMAIREVLQTGNEPTPSRYGVGDLYGHGIGAVRSNSYVYHATEWGYVITFLSVRPKAIYTNGVDRLWLKQDREDYFQRELQYIGQQAVKNGEIYITAEDNQNHATFGWNDRYSEYRRTRSRVSSEFRGDLNYWHLGRQFSGPAAPALNAEFVKCEPTKRIFNVQSRDTLWMMVQHQFRSRSVVDRSAYGKII